jgi:hypothetical protein
MKTLFTTLIIGITTLIFSGCFSTSSSTEPNSNPKPNALDSNQSPSTLDSNQQPSKLNSSSSSSNEPTLDSSPVLRSEFTANGNYEKELTDTEIQTDLEILADELDINSLDISGLQNNINDLSIETSSDEQSSEEPLAMRLTKTTNAKSCMPFEDLSEEKTTGVKGSGQYSYEKVVMSGPTEICDDEAQMSFVFAMDIEEEDGQDRSIMHMDGEYEINMDQSAQSMSTNADFSGYGTVTTGQSTVNLSFLMDMTMTLSEAAATSSMNIQTIVHLMDDKYRCTIAVSTTSDLFFQMAAEPVVVESNTCELTHNGQVVGSLQLDGKEPGVYDLDGNKIL